MRRIETPPPHPEVSHCTHHWICEESKGRTSQCICKHCHAITTLYNSIILNSHNSLTITHGPMPDTYDRATMSIPWDRFTRVRKENIRRHS